MRKKILCLLLFFIAVQTGIYGQTTPYVLLISFDGFRWDYTQRSITPNLDLLAENGTSAISLMPSFPSKTYPNHYSIITGMYPEHHGIIGNSFINPFTKEVYRLGDTISIRDEKWYKGEAFWETARKNGIITASMFWPGSEVNDAERRPDYFRYYDHDYPYEERLNQIFDWLTLPYPERPHFICGYFDATDGAGHNFGPESGEVNEAISLLDNVLGNLLKLLDETGMKDSVNVIIVSDHGMTGVSSERLINIEEMLDGYDCTFSDAGPTLLVFPDDTNQTADIYKALKNDEDHFKAYLKKDIPEYFHFSENPFIAPIVLAADKGWTLKTNALDDWLYRNTFKGNHGYSNFDLDMHGIFYAAGPLIKEGLRTGTVKNVDIYPLLCRIFNIPILRKIDGDAERIEFILR